MSISEGKKNENYLVIVAFQFEDYDEFVEETSIHTLGGGVRRMKSHIVNTASIEQWEHQQLSLAVNFFFFCIY